MKSFAPAALALALALSSLACSDSDSSGGGAASSTGTGGQGTGASGGNGAGGDGTGGDGTAGNATGGGGGGPLEQVHKIGRFTADDSFTWSGTSVGARFSGTGISVDLDGAQGAFFQVVLDGQPSDVFQTSGGAQSYVLAQGLAAGQHDVELYRRTEGFTGVVRFVGLTPEGGALVPSPAPYARKIEFIGDSITCGYGVEGADAFCNFTTDTETSYVTYAAIASRQVDAAAHLIAYSGKGVFQNYGGDKTELMPELWLRTLTDDAGTPWDFGAWQADAVVINLGSNDFSVAIAQNEFVPAYTQLLQDVRAKYPAAHIFCVGWTGWGGQHEQWVQDAMTQSGDANVDFVEFSIDPNDGWGCDYHPSATTHQKLGDQLAGVLKQKMGW